MKTNVLLTPLAGLLKAAYEEEGVKPPDGSDFKLVHREWELPTSGGSTIHWRHADFGTLAVQVKGHELSTTDEGLTNLRAKVLSKTGIKDSMTLWSFVHSADGVKVLHFQAGNMTDCTETPAPTLIVPITWDGQKPHTRVRNMDNVDFVFLREDGVFMQLQVSLTVRKGSFWIAIQEIYQGQVVRTTQKKAGELDLTFHQHGQTTGIVIPARPEDAFPGSDYLKIFPGMGPKLIAFAVDGGRSVQLSSCVIAEWTPGLGVLTQESQAGEYKLGHVAYFNLVCGLGNIVCEDGWTCFVHFNQIIDKGGRQIAKGGDFPALEPMTAVAVKWTESGQGRKATALRFDTDAVGFCFE